MYSLNSGGDTLTLYRIINPLANPATLNKYPVLYGHGVLYDSHSMITRSERSRPRKPKLGAPTIYYGDIDGSDDNSLPFMFSNNNFDVWLYDARGTNDINRNLSATTDIKVAQKFWDFSLDDEGLVDLPLMMNFVLTKTASQKLVYVGYSQSTFFMFALLSTVPEYADKVAAIVAMAPVSYVSHIRGLTIPLLAPVASLVPEFIHYSFLPQPVIGTVDVSLRNLCSAKTLGTIICGGLINGIGGKGKGEIAPDFFSNFFKSTSLKVVKQFLQLYVGKRFGMYDHGPSENMRRYGQALPPAYDLSRVKSDRIILARGLADFLSTPEDQDRLIRELGTKPYMDIVVPDYNHFDWIDGKDLIKLVNGPAMIGVYELMYKDGPNVLRTPEQNQAIIKMSEMVDQLPKPIVGAAPIAAPKSNVNRVDKQIGQFPLVKGTGKLIQKIFGTKDLVEQFAGK